MRLSLRLAVSLVASLSALAFVFAYIQVGIERRALQRDLERRSAILADAFRGTIESGPARDPAHLQRIVDHLGSRDSLKGIAIFNRRGELIASSPGLRDRLPPSMFPVLQVLIGHQGLGGFISLGATPAHVYAVPLHEGKDLAGAVAVFHDAGDIESRATRGFRDSFLRALLEALLLTLVTLLIVRRNVMGPVDQTVAWMRELRIGRAKTPPAAASPAIDPELLPLHTEVGHFARSLTAARAAAAEEARLRDAAESLWTPERLRAHVQNKLPGDGRRLFVLSNREPYLHVRRGKELEVVVPPSGLVTAIEPILLACDGVWVAHGSGDADREAVDEHDCLGVPPDDPQYRLRRVWLSKEEEDGYYFGFANEGLWPLCHIAHTRPTFRPSDWQHYHDVNEKFARVVLEEMKDVPEPSLLVQDYHFALVPRMVKQQRPDARVAIFWHIPWPNPEAFGICPQQRELLDGLLGADLIGFHIQAHCINFLETVDRALESRIELDRFAVNRRGHLTIVHPFPISIPFPEKPRGPSADFQAERPAVLKELGVEARYVGVGVDRVDYTKGILERFRGLENLLETSGEYRGRLSFIQVAAPSRMHIKSYQDLYAEVEREAARINQRWGTGNWRPIVLQGSRNHEQIDRIYRIADFCFVTSLHDGMNLVAKEFVAARHDEQGVLILSTFAGASRELHDALLVNPYDAPQLAAAVRRALEMSPAEQRDRMQRMRRTVRENSIYRWAANLIGELAEVRLESKQEEAEAVIA